MRRLEIAVERQMAAEADHVRELLHDAPRYPEWVATLREIEELESGVWRARCGYLGYERSLDCEPVDWAEDRVVWDGQVDDVTVRLDVALDVRPPRRTIVRFEGTLEAEERILGLHADHQLMRVSLRLAAEHSLGQLDRIAAAETPSIA